LGDVARVIAITGTRREAAVLRDSGVTVLSLGGVSAVLGRLEWPIGGIISFGMAGALSPDLRIGDWIIGERVCGGFEAECDPQWRAALASALPGAGVGPVYADGRLIGDPAEKQTLRSSHGAIAADMESHLAAEAAARAGAPFAILRCISDEASHALPPAIAVAMAPDGKLALGAILGSIIRKPVQTVEFIKTIRTFSNAYEALKAGSARIDGRLAFDLR
jgi:adenosylhomocysteine nucleosidase